MLGNTCVMQLDVSYASSSWLFASNEFDIPMLFFDFTSEYTLKQTKKHLDPSLKTSAYKYNQHNSEARFSPETYTSAF